MIFRLRPRPVPGAPAVSAAMLKADGKYQFHYCAPVLTSRRRPPAKGLSAQPVSIGFCQPYVQVVKWLYRDSA